MKLTATILAVGMLAVPTALSINESTSEVSGQTVVLYEPDNDDPTAEFPLIIVDTSAAYTAWCTASENNDEPFFVTMPGDNAPTDTFLRCLAQQIENSKIDSQRVYVVASSVDSPLLKHSSDIFTYSTAVNPADSITPELINNLLSHIKP